MSTPCLNSELTFSVIGEMYIPFNFTIVDTVYLPLYLQKCICFKNKMKKIRFYQLPFYYFNLLNTKKATSLYRFGLIGGPTTLAHLLSCP